MGSNDLYICLLKLIWWSLSPMQIWLSKKINYLFCYIIYFRWMLLCYLHFIYYYNALPSLTVILFVKKLKLSTKKNSKHKILWRKIHNFGIFNNILFFTWKVQIPLIILQTFVEIAFVLQSQVFNQVWKYYEFIKSCVFSTSYEYVVWVKIFSLCLSSIKLNA